jgi:hypothetical protein
MNLKNSLEHLENKGKTKKKPFPPLQKEKKLDPSCVHPEPFYWLHEAFIPKTVDTILGLQAHKL